MHIANRRVFMIQAAVAGSAVMGHQALMAQGAMVSPKDPQAMALGYVEDTAKVDAKKYPRHAATQQCSNCQLYTGKAGAVSGPCGVFPGKQVTAKGWCSTYVKKA